MDQCQITPNPFILQVPVKYKLIDFKNIHPLDFNLGAWIPNNGYTNYKIVIKCTLHVWFTK